MFNGIVEAIGAIKKIKHRNDCLELTIQTPAIFADLKEGDSIAVNGVCLTIFNVLKKKFSVMVVPETLRLTNLAGVRQNDEVNIERALPVNARLSGHFVQGHVDGKALITDIKEDGEEALLVTFTAPKSLLHYIVKKGYIAIDGMSLTVVTVTKKNFLVTFIPYTKEHTIVKNYAVNTIVNLEVDILAKYIEKLIGK